MKIAVTGAGGFIGSALCRAAIAEGHEVVEIGRTALVDGTFSSALIGVDTLVHLAGIAHRSNVDEQDFVRSNHELSVEVARQAAGHGVKRFVFVSSIGVHGNKTEKGEVATENSPLFPQEQYARSKLMAESSLRSLSQQLGFELVIVRPPLVYGKDAPGNFSKLDRLVKRGIPVPIGLVKNKRTFVYVDNLSSALLACARHPKAANETFVVCDDESISTRELMRSMARARGKNILLPPVPYVALFLAAACVGKTAMLRKLTDSLVVSNARIKHVLGWEPPFSLDEGIKRSLHTG